MDEHKLSQLWRIESGGECERKGWLSFLFEKFIILLTIYDQTVKTVKCHLRSLEVRMMNIVVTLIRKRKPWCYSLRGILCTKTLLFCAEVKVWNVKKSKTWQGITKLLRFLVIFCVWWWVNNILARGLGRKRMREGGRGRRA